MPPQTSTWRSSGCSFRRRVRSDASGGRRRVEWLAPADGSVRRHSKQSRDKQQVAAAAATEHFRCCRRRRDSVNRLPLFCAAGGKQQQATLLLAAEREENRLDLRRRQSERVGGGGAQKSSWRARKRFVLPATWALSLSLLLRRLRRRKRASQ